MLNLQILQTTTTCLDCICSAYCKVCGLTTWLPYLRCRWMFQKLALVGPWNVTTQLGNSGLQPLPCIFQPKYSRFPKQDMGLAENWLPPNPLAHHTSPHPNGHKLRADHVQTHPKNHNSSYLSVVGFNIPFYYPSIKSPWSMANS